MLFELFKSHIVAVQPEENSRPMAKQQQNTDHHSCSVYVGQHTSESLYTAELYHIIAGHQLQLHMYADDSQVYVTMAANDATVMVICLSAAIVDLNDWMKASRLRLNSSMTMVMWLATKQQLDKIDIKDVPLLPAIVTVLGIIIDSQLSMEVHAASICHYQL